MINSNEVLSNLAGKNELKGTYLDNCGCLHQNHPRRDPYLKTVFKCAMKCEGDKSFIAPGNCPVCNVVLEQVAELQQDYY